MGWPGFPSLSPTLAATDLLRVYRVACSGHLVEWNCQYVLFRGCPMSVNIIFWSFIHIVSCIRTSFLWPSSLVRGVDVSHFIYPFTTRWTCSLHPLFAVVINAVANICVYIGHFHFSWVYIYTYPRVELLDHMVTLCHVEELPT